MRYGFIEWSCILKFKKLCCVTLANDSVLLVMSSTKLNSLSSAQKCRLVWEMQEVTNNLPKTSSLFKMMNRGKFE